MLDIAPSELLLTAIVAIVVIGPKDMPLALRTAGRWIGKMRRMSNHVRSGFEAMIREAEMEEMERKWREQNEAILAAHPAAMAEAAMLPLSSPVDYTGSHHAPAHTIEQPVIEQPVIEQPVIEQPVAEQPVAEQPVIAQALGEHGAAPATSPPQFADIAQQRAAGTPPP